MAKATTLAAGIILFALLAWRTWQTGPLRVARAFLHGLAWTEHAWQPGLPAADRALWFSAYAVGLAYLWRLSGQSYAVAALLGPASAALLLLPQWPAFLRYRKLDITPLVALLVPCAIGLAWGLHVLPAQSGATLLQAAELAAVGYVLLVQVERRPALRCSTAAVGLLGATGAWAIVEYLGGHTQGVTGSDPYCYAQMAVDLVRHGDARHVFDLLPVIRDLGIPWWPVVHVGYHVPDGASGLAATVWPVGWPVLLAAGYWLLGEAGLYVWAPLMGLLALVATAALVTEVWPGGRPRWRWLAIALAAFILATSREQVLQLLVPMADVAAQLFTLLAVWLALRAGRRSSWPLAVAAGLALGVAYDIRHTQVVLAPVLACAVWTKGSRRRAALLVAASASGAMAAAAPDLWYHQVAFGSIWRPESPETYLIGAQYWLGNALRMWQAMASRAEFGLLLPFLIYGAWRLWREERRAATVLLAWIALNAGTQFLYGPLRWRDLLAIMPALAVLTALGAVWSVQRLGEVRRGGSWASGWLALGLVLALAWRSGTVLAWPTLRSEMTFGYMLAGQREAFTTLGRLVEPDAVVGTALNSGPIELYTGRQTFRPADWSPAELDVFLAAMAAGGRPVYLMDDGNEQAATVARLGDEGRLVPVRVLDVPLYGERGALTGTLYRVR